ncbi:ABC transporter substrate-binding protein [Sinisalibacter aestuarii]|uniref:SsuA/THI5-like domain-containing protein n=1 Tax=Sinisalibacter aestuarii TaxID=2949426 RepID=A0ABQ5LZ07_9RHOB|nr:ABC transporter substrate-binding protein [Sinisalibacter aestuarii]GKY89631.1 hypothetical protein STA1M1_35000 [Sinisalibacter aestuarii]
MTLKLMKISAMTAASVIAMASAASAETKALTVALPVNLCLANWPFYVAAENGEFAAEGLEVTMVGLDGSSTAIQATLAGQAQIAATAPADMLAASGAGADVTGFYNFYQYLPFRLVTATDSDITSLADLEGKTVGITSAGGGEAIYMRSLLAHAGLSEGSYEELAVGEGSMAASAITGGAVDAHSASFVDEIIFGGMGLAYKALDSEGYPATTGEMLMAQTSYFNDNPDVIEGIGRALARATAAGLANRELVVTACGNAAPHETEDMGFTNAVLDGVDALFVLGDAAGGQYGFIEETTWAAYKDLMVSIGAAGEEALAAPVSNAYVSAWNAE